MAIHADSDYCVAWRALAPRVRPLRRAFDIFETRESACGAAGGGAGPAARAARAGETQAAHLRAPRARVGVIFLGSIRRDVLRVGVFV